MKDFRLNSMLHECERCGAITDDGGFTIDGGLMMCLNCIDETAEMSDKEFEKDKKSWKHRKAVNKNVQTI